MTLRKVQAASAAATFRCTRRVVVRAAAKTEVPPNVAEARAWIAAWRAKQGQQPKPASGNGKPAAAAAPKATKAAKGAGGKFGAASAMPDGTLVFTAEQLTSVDYSDVKLKGKK